MIDKLIKVDVDGVEYPLAFNLNVIENIQEEYGDVEQWQELLSPSGSEMPSIKALKKTFAWFINEGIDIENDDLEVKRPFITEKQVGRLITKMGTNSALKNIFNVASQNVPQGGEDPNEKSQAIQK